MALRDDIPVLIQTWKDQQKTIQYNSNLFDIFEGNLLPYVLRDLQDQLSEQAYTEASKRVAPINILRRLVEKLSKIYQRAPIRKIDGGSATDLELMSQYVEVMDFNTALGASDGANGFFNLFKSLWIKPYLEDGEPRLRIIPPYQFFVYSNNPINPNCPTHYVEIMGTLKDQNGNEKTYFYAYTDEEFLAFDEDKNILADKMRELDLEEGGNPIGALPGIYINRSKHCLMPKPDTDTLQMTKLIPVLLTDLNYALMYQVFSVMYTIDVDQSNLKAGPNALWDLKSQAGMGADAKPQVGVVKPEVDSEKALDLIKALFALWMETRNIKSGSIGQMQVKNAASGIAKAIDEMDTAEDRQNQVPFFKAAEQKLWRLIMETYHPYWLETDPAFMFKGVQFSKTAKVQVTFSEQRAIVDNTASITDQVAKLAAGIQSHKGALEELYPDWDEGQVLAKLKEIEDEIASGKFGPVMAPGKPQLPAEPAQQPAFGKPQSPSQGVQG
jgi:hypothetical protein